MDHETHLALHKSPRGPRSERSRQSSNRRLPPRPAALSSKLSEAPASWSSTNASGPFLSFSSAPLSFSCPTGRPLVARDSVCGSSELEQPGGWLKVVKGEALTVYANRTDLTAEEKLQFVGKKGSYQLNLHLSPAKLGDKRSFILDNVLYTTMLKGMNLPKTETQAVAHSERGFGGINTLRAPSDVSRFLKPEAIYPVFAKPLEGSKYAGSALLTGIDAAKGLIEMGNGKSFDVEVDAFAHEVIADYP